jgi:hypothetical protein
MSDSSSILRECETVLQYARRIDRSYNGTRALIDEGLPIFFLKGRRYVHVPTAEKWLSDKIKSRPAKTRRVR